MLSISEEMSHSVTSTLELPLAMCFAASWDENCPIPPPASTIVNKGLLSSPPLEREGKTAWADMSFDF
jgi:hypothetical protein